MGFIRNCGIYAVLGNHDICYGNSKLQITTGLENIGINVLWNQIAYPLGNELPLVGLTDFFSKEFNPARVMNQLYNNLAILMEEKLSFLDIVETIPTKLRRRVPLLRRNYFVVPHWECSQGLHQLGKNQLYVNRGLGTYLPGRFFCPPEVTIITLMN